LTLHFYQQTIKAGVERLLPGRKPDAELMFDLAAIQP
jgi:hypothetical protein